MLTSAGISHAENRSGDLPTNDQKAGPERDSSQEQQGRFERIENIRRRLKQTLAILSAETGTDPTAILGQISPRTRYQSQTSDQRVQEILRISVPFAPDWILRVDTPFTYLDPDSPNEKSVAGLSDIRLRVGARVLKGDDGAVFLGTEVYFPTATNPQLGGNEYRVGPTVVGSYRLPDWQSTAYLWVEYLTGVTGQIGRGSNGGASADDSSTSELRIRTRFSTLWSKTWWSFVEPRLFVDFDQNAKTGAVLLFEWGRRLDKHWRVYLRPEVGLWGQSVPGAFNYGVEFGVRYMFYVF